MVREITITTDPIDESALRAGRGRLFGVGAVITFLGVVRGTEDGGAIQGIEYEAFAKMAEHQFELLFDDVQRRWPVRSIRLVHRIGFVPQGEPSLWVEVLAPHRGEAFEACQHLIDQMKRVVPIWKHPRR